MHESGIVSSPQVPVENYRLDLAVFDGGRHLDIEIDGEYYHRTWSGELVRRDQIRNQRLIELGWDVQRFWVYQYHDDLQGSIERVRSWVQGPAKAAAHPSLGQIKCRSKDATSDAAPNLGT